MASVSVRECIRDCWRSVRHINWQTGTAVSKVDTSNLLLQKRMPPPECASLISNLVLISSCCPLRRIRWQLGFEETFFTFSFFFLSPTVSLSSSLSLKKRKTNLHLVMPCSSELKQELTQECMIWACYLFLVMSGSWCPSGVFFFWFLGGFFVLFFSTYCRM